MWLVIIINPIIVHLLVNNANCLWQRLDASLSYSINMAKTMFNKKSQHRNNKIMNANNPLVATFQQTLRSCILGLRVPPLSIVIDVIQNHAESWLDSLFDSSNSLLILVYQIVIYISRDNILWACTNFTGIIVQVWFLIWELHRFH